MSKRWTEVLCTKCGGNGVVKIPGGVSQCPRCDGRCYEPEPASLQSIQRREGVGVAEAMRIQAAEPLAAISDLALIEACDSRFGSLTLYGRGSVHLILEQLKSYVEEGTAAMAAAPSSTPVWEPIESCPQDSQMVLVAARVTRNEPLETMFAYWNQQHSWWYRLYAHEPTRIYPTHWMPLPVPPQEQP